MSALRTPRPVTRPVRRLVCFPWAGSSASVYRSWATALPAGVELVSVQYPGREDRAREPFATDLEALAGDVVDELVPVLDEAPLTLFGHSAGAGVALATARLIEQDFPAAVSTLVVSGRRAPSEPSAERPVSDLDGAGDQLDALRSALGPADLTDEMLREIVIPTLRADLEMLAGYDARPGEPIAADLTAFTGDADPSVPITSTDRWAELTTGRFTRLVFPGDHFYLLPERERVLSALVAHMSR
ncbi:thioesterase II family protein [Pseudonocardia spinosispora]|uniref:thioesterase II family protein n=1 Tax=Pseudonocardia spinosispora TaxID=103441 RepID=UPI00042A7C70|nr:alpha/beta fold hydrolase [Pseudonocardia spinosispora]